MVPWRKKKEPEARPGGAYDEVDAKEVEDKAMADHSGLLHIDLTLDRDQVKQMFTYDVDNWFMILFAIKGRSVPWRPWLLVMTFTACFLAIHKDYFAIFGPFFDKNINTHVHSTFGIVLGFLIVYQSSQSNQRWWEGRCAWENIITNSRESIRILCAHCNGREVIKLFTRYILAYGVCCKAYLRHENFTATGRCPELAKILPRTDCDRLYRLHPRHRPLACLYAVQRIVEVAIKKQLIPRGVARDVNPRFISLSDNLGACERILYTPMPWVYTLHLRIIMFFYLIFLPLMFANIGDGNKDLLPNAAFILGFVAIIAYAFLGLEDMAVQIQNPFGNSMSDLPMDIYLQEIQDDAVETIKMKYFTYGEGFSEKLEHAVFKSNVRRKFELPNKRIWLSEEYKNRMAEQALLQASPQPKK